MHPNEFRMLNTNEAARYLGLGNSTLTKLRLFGGGPVFLKLGRRVAYDPRDLDKWAESRRRVSTSDPGREPCGSWARERYRRR
jgi:hypothetical protein